MTKTKYLIDGIETIGIEKFIEWLTERSDYNTVVWLQKSKEMFYAENLVEDDRPHYLDKHIKTQLSDSDRGEESDPMTGNLP